MLWINPEDFKNSSEMHNIPFALSLCNGLGMGDAQGDQGGKIQLFGIISLLCK